ncbi:hypothetical protein MPTK2_3g09220 [Marchantia polymorpha subsp. ruderalis]
MSFQTSSVFIYLAVDTSSNYQTLLVDQMDFHLSQSWTWTIVAEYQWTNFQCSARVLCPLYGS